MNSFEKLRRMTEGEMNIKLAPLTNVIKVDLIEGDKGEVLIGVDGDAARRLMNHPESFAGGLILADKTEFDQLEEDDNTVLGVQSVRVKITDGKVETFSMEEKTEEKISVEDVAELLHGLNIPVDGEPVPVVREEESVWIVGDVDDFEGGVESRYCYVDLRLLCALR